MSAVAIGPLRQMRGVVVMLGVVGVVSLLVQAGAMALADPRPAGSPGDLPCPVDTDAVVFIRNFEYDDAATGLPLTVAPPGGTVCWVWTEGVHSVTQGVRGPYEGPLGPSLFDSGTRAAAHDSMGTPLVGFSFTFDAPGVHGYYCRPHHQQLGAAVVVTTAAGGV